MATTSSTVSVNVGAAIAATATSSGAGTMEGTLSKWTNVMKGWQYRFFVLDENAGLLSYYTVCMNVMMYRWMFVYSLTGKYE